MLIAFGAFSNPALYVQSLGININLNWGVILLIFGLIMLFLERARCFSRARDLRHRPPTTGRRATNCDLRARC